MLIKKQTKIDPINLGFHFLLGINFFKPYNISKLIPAFSNIQKKEPHKNVQLFLHHHMPLMQTIFYPQFSHNTQSFLLNSNP